MHKKEVGSMKEGDIVQSHFRACWYGQLLELRKVSCSMGGSRATSILARVQLVCTKDGRPQKPMIKELAAGYLRKTQLPDRYYDLVTRKAFSQ